MVSDLMSNSPASAVEPPPTLSVTKRVVFALVLLGLVATVLEVGAQVYLRATRGYAGGEFMQYQFDPYKNIVLTPNWRDTRGVSHNSQGFRGSVEYAREKEPGTFRVVLMGASTAYGLGGMWPHLQTEFQVLNDSTTIDRYLERMLADAFPGKRVEVINAGIPSIWTHHELIYLNQAVLAYDPDVVLFLDGWNDHFFFSRDHDQFASYVQTEQASKIMGEPTLKSLVRMNAWWLFRKSAFAHVAGRAVQALIPALQGGPSPLPIDPDSATAIATEVFDRSARKMLARNALILRHEGIPALFMLQPVLALERDRLDRMPEIERALFEFNLSAERPGYEAYLRRIVPIVSERVRETVVPLGASYLDLTAIYGQPQGQIFTDYCHLTPTGNRLLAAHILPEVIRLGQQRIALLEGRAR
jgi:lysophospholipase L1-like esterase